MYKSSAPHYGAGLNDAEAGGSVQWANWNDAYENLTDVNWLAVHGNHDLGKADAYFPAFAEEIPWSN